MANILGNYILKCSDEYKQKKDIFKSFDDFFMDYLNEITLDKDILFDIINDFFLKEFLKIKESTTDEEIEEVLSLLKERLVKKQAIKENCNIKELIGYILLGNILNN